MRRRVFEIKKQQLDRSTVQLLHFNENLLDEISKKSALSGSVNSFIDGQFGKAAYFNRNKIDYDASSLNFSGDWTVDFWWMDKDVNNTIDNIGFFTNTSYTNMVTWTGAGLSLRWMYDNPTSNSVFRAYFNTTTRGSTEQFADWKPVRSFFKDRLHHIAMVKHSATGYLFVDGDLKASRANVSSNGAFVENIRLGEWTRGGFASGFNIGIFDEFRISNIARWTSNFTPPTKPY